LTKLRAKLDKRFYTTSLAFARDLSSVFSAGIANEPPAKPIHTEPINIPSPKKHATDMKVRKSLAKRIIKAVQPQLEAAVRAEAEISNKPVENLLKELEAFMDASLQSRRDSVSASTGEAVSLGDAEGDVEMTGTIQPKQNGVEHANGESSSAQQTENADKNETKDEDMEMQDEDAPHEVDDTDTVAVALPGELDVINAEDTIISAPLAEVDGNVSSVKPHKNGVKNASTPPDTNGYVTAPESQPPAPPTPPVSNGGHAADNTDLNTGGVLWYLKDFQPEGTSIMDPHASRMSEELSDMDDEELKVLGGDVDEADGDVVGAVGTNPSKSKKSKAKKRWRGYR
jgi:NuA3 HAT complex component NTO1